MKYRRNLEETKKNKSLGRSVYTSYILYFFLKLSFFQQNFTIENKLTTRLAVGILTPTVTTTFTTAMTTATATASTTAAISTTATTAFNDTTTITTFTRTEAMHH